MEIIYSDGRFQVLSDNFSDYTEISILDNRQDEIVLEAKFVGDDWITVLTSENNFISLDLFEMKKKKFIKPECLEFNSPQCWFPDKNGGVIFALNSCLYKHTIEDELIQKQIGYETICHMVCDRKRNNLMILTSDSRLLVLGTLEFNVKIDVNVQESVDVFSVSGMNWLDDDRLVVLENASNGKATIVDLLEGESLQVSLAKNFVSCCESDGLRIIQNGSNWLITLMPECMSDFNTGKSKFAQFFDMYAKGDLEGITCLSSVNLSEIVDLISKSLLMFAYEKRLQEQISNFLKVAVEILEEQLGKDHNSKHTFSYITANCNRAITECSVLTKLQQKNLAVSPCEFNNKFIDSSLLSRLCRLDLHGLAFECSVLLELDLSIVLMDWTKKMIETSRLSDKELWMTISDKLLTWGTQKNQKLDYISLSEVAIKHSRPKIALKLLKFENDTRRKIELLVQLNDYREAVIESVQSGRQDQSNA